MKEKHESFYGFYPSEFFDMNTSKEPRIIELELTNRSIEELNELKKLYSKQLVSLSGDKIISKCEYAKRVLNSSMEDIDYFFGNSQKIATDLIPLLSLFTSILALTASIFNSKVFVPAFLAFGICGVVGACMIYVISVKHRQNNSKLKEIYRKSTMCFETIEELAREKGV